jgi:GAF domain-containing protein
MTEEPVAGTREAAESGAAADARFAAELRRLFTLAGAADVLAAPLGHSELLQRIVEIASRVLAARAASLYLVDEANQELVFEVTLGPKAGEVKKFRVPLGHGIAGLVAASGQPMSVSDIEKDPRLATDIARSVGYWPSSILCVPLVSDDKVIGVLELFDKEGAPSFSPADGEVLGLFGNLAAIAIEQSRTHRNLTLLIGEVLVSLTGASGGPDPGFRDRARAFLGRLEKEDAAYGRALELARLVREVGEGGDRELRACRAILAGFLEYVKSRPGPDALPGGGM